jgi:hypothetical protein
MLKKKNHSLHLPKNYVSLLALHFPISSIGVLTHLDLSMLHFTKCCTFLILTHSRLPKKRLKENVSRFGSIETSSKYQPFECFY